MALGLGRAGANGRELAAAFLAAQPGLALIALDNDGITNLLGCHGGRPGAVIAAGTGTVGMALRADGSRQMVSGWGFRWGDEGSGSWLGLQAMALAQQALDGRCHLGALSRAVWAACGGAERDALLAWCRAAGATETAALAPLVFAAAQVGDAQAERLLAKAAQQLGKVAKALDARLPLVITGSIGLRLADRLPATVQQRRVAAQGDAVDGALHLLRLSLSGS
ncbi:MAG: BadF/BadG/BcrA/BcrD ATPase family protein [Inhella sp.]